MKQHVLLQSTTKHTLPSRAFGHIVLGLTLTFWMTFGVCRLAAHAQTYQKQSLYSFGGGANGATPMSGLIDVNGILYGTTQSGGTQAGNGTIFSIDPITHVETTVYRFNGYPFDGANPVASLININGLLYGTTHYGGTNGAGTLFSFDPSNNTELPLYSFGSKSGDGRYPLAALITLNGILYGTTVNGGTSGYGTLFSYNPATGKEAMLSSFGTTTSDGKYPYGGLITLYGILYGTTEFGGSANEGTVFSFDPASGTRSLIHTFSNTTYVPDGSEPAASLIAINGVLYGSTDIGGPNGFGTVFSVNPNATGYRTLHNFTDTNGDGAIPLGGLMTVNGQIYGTTEEGGTTGYGTLFSLDPSSGQEIILGTFQGGTTDGGYSAAGLVNVNGIFYGTTQQGGSSNEGTIFSLTSLTPPTAVTHSVKVKRNSTLTDDAPGVLGNVNDGGSSPMTALLVTNVSHGTLALKSDGSFVYTPTTGFAGKDSFTYQAVNSVGSSNVATCYENVLPTAPIAVTHSVKVTHNITLNDPAPGVLGNVDNGGSSPMTAVLVTKPTHGTLTLNSNGGFVYTPTTGFTGTDSFTYQAANSVGKSSSATTFLTVQ